jgi:N-methylhydantoinase B
MPQYAIVRAGPSRLAILSPGGGGVGDPLDRPVHKVVRDVRDGLVSAAMAREAYGVVMQSDLRRADVSATAALRSARRTPPRVADGAVR